MSSSRNRNRSDVIFFKLEQGWTHLGMVMETVYKKADSRIRFYLFFLDFNMIFHLFPGFFLLWWPYFRRYKFFIR